MTEVCHGKKDMWLQQTQPKQCLQLMSKEIPQKFKFGSNGSLVGTTFAVSLAKDETRLLTSKTRVKVAGLQRQGSVKMKSENCVKPRMTESEGEVDKLKVLGGRRGNERPQDPNIMESWSGWCQTWSMNLVDGAASERRECLRWCC